MAQAAQTQHNDIDELDALFSDAQDDALEPGSPAATHSPDELLDIEETLADVEQDAEKEQPTPIALKVPQNTSSDTPKKAGKTKSGSRFARGASLVDYAKTLMGGTGDFYLDAADADESGDTISEANLQRFEDVQAVKVREKLANLLAWAIKGNTLSTYTRTTMELLAKGKPVSKADVRNNLLDCGVGIGTASSQAGQMTHLIQAAKLATFTGGMFIPNADSVLLTLLGSSAPTAASTSNDDDTTETE